MRRRIGFLPENPYFYDYLTAEELLTLLRRACRAARARRAARACREVLDEVGIGAERRMRLRSYSKGMIQRVGVAQALRRPSRTSCSSTSRCRGSIRSAAAICGS